ncbi:MAG: hypothetical protein JJV97_04080 [SAR324 cluster bacterium]|nr:hypothetical protein [SAR324 cluster bacterium]
MAEESNNKVEDFSSFDEMDLDKDSKKDLKDDNSAPSEKKDKDESNLDDFFSDLNQLDQEVTADAEDKSNDDALPADPPSSIPADNKKPYLGSVAPRKPRSKMKVDISKLLRKIFIYGLGVLLIVGVGFGGYFIYKTNFFSNMFGFTSNSFDYFDDLLEKDLDEFDLDDFSSIKNNNITLQEGKLASKDEFSEFVIDKNGLWRVQVGVCIKSSCVRAFKKVLNPLSASKRIYTTETKTINSYFAKIYAVDLYQDRISPSAIINKINKNSNFGVRSYLEKTKDDRYQLVIGIFPLSTYGINQLIDKVEQELATIAPNLLLDSSYEQKKSTATKLFLGPFALKDDAQKALDILHSKQDFEQAFLIRR